MDPETLRKAVAEDKTRILTLLSHIDQAVSLECHLFSSQSSKHEPIKAVSCEKDLNPVDQARLQQAHFIKCLEASGLDSSLVQRIGLLSCPDVREFLKMLELQLLQAILNSDTPSYHAKVASAWLACENHFANMNKSHVG